jgi:uncharacterized protein
VRAGASVRAVIDTNVLLSALLWAGNPYMLMEQVRAGALTLVSSRALPQSWPRLRLVRSSKIFSPGPASVLSLLLAQVRLLAEIVDPPPLPEPVSRDLDDDGVLALAVAARPDLIITGDKDLLVLGAYAGIPIVSAAEAVAMIAPRP